MNGLEIIAGKICEIILPIKEEYCLGNHDSNMAICTLSSTDLLKDIANSEIIHNIALVGRLFTENNGIDSLIRFSNKHKIKKIILCGKEVWGHKAGHALLALHKNGIDDYGRIINSISPKPFVTISKDEVDYFQNNTVIINKIGETSLDIIKELI